MRILHVIDTLALGGAQGLSLRVIDGLQRRGLENRLLVLAGPERTHPTWSLPIEPSYLSFAGDYRRPVDWSRCVSRLREAIVAFRPDVVQSYNWLADVSGARACRPLRVRHVAYLVDRREWLTSRDWKHRFRRWVSRSVYFAAETRFVAVSEAVAEFAAAQVPLPRYRIKVVRNGIDVAQFRAIAEERMNNRSPVVLGMLGRFVAEKGHACFLDAIEELLRRRASVRVLIAGEGPLRSEVERRAATPSLAESVEVRGPVNEARGFYREVDVFVVPSIHSEGLPTTILEAMASGCVVVATRVGGASEVIRSGIDGLLVRQNSGPALADALESAVVNPSLRSRLRESGLARVAAFDMDRVLRELLQLYTGATTGENMSGDAMVGQPC